MTSKKYTLFNNILGWGVFLIAAFVYLSTIEPTTSFWDCGEFIATAFKLEVGHPPGAPLYLMVARFFSLLSFGDVTKVGLMINSLSAIVSAFTIMFLFWTITHLAKKIVIKNYQLKTAHFYIIFGSALVGALAYTFSDTFWFSAVEGEVYATSSLFTAVVFWAILKWENIADQKYANRWLILIAYLMGLSIGVHLLNLLAIPAIVFVYYFKKYPVTRKGIIAVFFLSISLIAVMMYGVIHGFVFLASKFELLFVNQFNVAYNTGFVFYLVLIFGLILAGIVYSYRTNKPVLNTGLTMLLVILIGYSSFSMIYIRSLANPPIDENDPENIFALRSYLNREQYGDRPLIYGKYYNAPIKYQPDGKPYKNGKPKYIQDNGRYIIAEYKPEYDYDSRFETIFPRMYSANRNHVDAYQSWANIKGKNVKVQNRNGNTEIRKKPTFGENLKFFFNYQLGHMYFRYFMWNFAGRQNDEQSHGGYQDGNWISGISFLDEIRLGPQDALPDYMKNNKARNKYYLFPLILGLLGLLFQINKDPKNFSVTALLFFFTGIAIVIYLNQTPVQPRERDYAYAGSFYAFAIWMGLGVISVWDSIKKYFSTKMGAILSTLIALVAVPLLMAFQNWDDHDRSDRYTARDLAVNYLNSCQKNAILITFGDNDTFPLWYVQEVEGIRTDVRVVNYSLLSGAWYIDQMKLKAYKSEPLPIKMPHKKYRPGTRDIVPVFEKNPGYMPLKQAMNFVLSDDINTQFDSYSGKMNYLPTPKLSLPVDSAKVIRNGTVPENKANKIVPAIKWQLNKRYLYKSDLALLDLLANNNWKRPVYFASSSGSSSYLNLMEYFRLEGFAYRLVPYKTEIKNQEIGDIDTGILFENLVNKFKWGNMQSPEVFIDYQNRRIASVMDIREKFARLANELNVEGKNDSAIIALDKGFEIMPHEKYPYSYYALLMAKNYYIAGAPKKANKKIKIIAEKARQDIAYGLSLPPHFEGAFERDMTLSFQIAKEIIRLTKQYGQESLSNQLQKMFAPYFAKIQVEKG